jgi:hypothetical protein
MNIFNVAYRRKIMQRHALSNAGKPLISELSVFDFFLIQNTS